MKLRNFLVLMAMTLCFVACSDDDETVSLSAVVGTYESYATASFMSMTMVTNDENITLTANADNQTVNLTYDGTWGTGSATGLTVTESNGTYTVSGSGTVQAAMSGQSLGTYEFTVTGIISGDDASFTFAFALGAMGTVNVVTELGVAPAAEFLPGTYAGYTSAAFQYSSTPIVTDDESIAITADDSGAITVTYTSATWGTGTFTGVTAAYDEANKYYTLDCESGVMAMPSHSGSGTSNYDCTLSGTVSADGETMDLTMTCPAVMGGTTITFALGDAPTE